MAPILPGTAYIKYMYRRDHHATNIWNMLVTDYNLHGIYMYT